jgi:hypothetical protein
LAFTLTGMHKYVLLLVVSLLTLPGTTEAQKKSGDLPPQYNARRTCSEIAIQRAERDFKEVLELAKQKGIGVLVNVESDRFGLTCYVGGGDRSDQVIFNYSCAVVSDTGTSIDNCLGVLWVGSIPLSVQK